MLPTLDLRSLTRHRVRLVVSGTTPVLVHVILRVRRFQGITNVEFAPKTILCSIVLSDAPPSPKLTSILRSNRDLQAPTRLRTA